MNAQQLLAHFDRLAEAPGAVPRLRRFILDLAVRGKLVEQDAGDEPAAELLRRIEGEIAQLVAAGEMRKPKLLPPIEAEDEPFAAPLGWQWVRIRQITSDRGQTIPSSDFTYIDVGSINKEMGILGEHQVLSPGDAPSRARKVVCKGDVLYSCVRPTLLNIAVVEHEIIPRPIASTAFAVLNGFGLVLPRYLWIALRSPYLEAIVQAGMRGQAYPAINDAEFALLPLALPPLAEQHRIVAKVDELMALCDQLEAAQQERERRRDCLASASLQRLSQPAADTTPEAQREHARFHLHHLPRLTTRPEHIKAMRQTILNLAVRGLLVRNYAGEESATTLLSSIASTKSNLVKAGVIRKTAGLAPLSPEDAVFQVSGGWVWERLGTVGYTQTGTTPPTSMPECFGGKTPFVTPSDLTASVTTYDGKGLTEIGVKHSRLIAKNSVLMVCIGSTIGKVNVVDREVCCNQQINTLTPVVDGMTGYVAIALRSDYFQELVITNAGMGTLPILSKGKWEQLPVPIPPLAEQHRIVAKVDELMALCDQLEVQLSTTQTDSRRLLEAVLEAALAPT